jgi:itaconate CoA-transferase
MRPLDGITVVSLEQAISAPLATRHLADLGARVIKIERPGTGDFARDLDHRARGLSSHFVWTNRSKESLTLDLKHPQACSLVSRLLDKADVVVQNLAPGAAARLGFSAGALRSRHPRLIVCEISGYGANGPYSGKKAYDLLIQAEAGLLSVTGTPEQPAKAGIAVADIAAGMHAYSSILAALILRGRTGQGSHIEISMMEALCEWMQHPLHYSIDGGQPPRRTGAFHATIVPYGPFVAGDGATVFFGIQNEREWAAFCSIVLERPELVEDERCLTAAVRLENREAVTRVIQEVLSRWTAKEVLRRLDAAQVANASMNGMAQVWDHQQLKARGCWHQIASPAGPIPALLPPGRCDAFEPRMGPVPALGEHTEAILIELGYTESEIALLRTERAV